MNGFLNIEIINFEGLNYDEDIQDLRQEELNNFLFNKLESDQESLIETENGIQENISSSSYFSDHSLVRSNSCTSLPVMEKSCLSSDNILHQQDIISMSHFSSFSPNICNNSSSELMNSLTKSKSFHKKHKSETMFHSEKQFECEYENCIKIYKSKENLSLHIKNIHMNIKPYSCRYCNALFSHRNGKTYHERKFHTNYLPHACQQDTKGNIINIDI
jgi:hypothetical protein